MLSQWQFCRQAAWTSQIPRHQHWCKASTRSFAASVRHQNSDPIPDGQVVHSIADREDSCKQNENSSPQPSESIIESSSAPKEADSNFKKMCFIGIDPDTGGAIAYISIDGGDADLSQANVEVIDAPVKLVVTGKRTRRQIDPERIAFLLEDLRDRKLGAMKTFLEKPLPLPINGSFSNHQSGISFGVWYGSLCANHIDTKLVLAAKWKRDLDLFRKPKEGSIARAIELFPAALHMLKRKKDHGRAEALLIAYWGMKYGHLMVNDLALPKKSSRKSNRKRRETLAKSQKSPRKKTGSADTVSGMESPKPKAGSEDTVSDMESTKPKEGSENTVSDMESPKPTVVVLVDHCLEQTTEPVGSSVNGDNKTDDCGVDKDAEEIQKKSTRRRIRVCDRIFSTTRAVVEAGLAKDIRQVRRRVESDNQKWKDWLRC
ncbi:hypothetical protein BSKO_11201 [Bryopsis sp. KO-2023]|nr:hypothetical protein BSKO_11201 [Bryopsis sp. KO-2023]